MKIYSKPTMEVLELRVNKDLASNDKFLRDLDEYGTILSTYNLFTNEAVSNGA